MKTTVNIVDPQIGMRAQSESNWMVKYIAYANKHVTQQQVINDQCEHISYFLIIWDMELLTTQCLLGNFFFLPPENLAMNVSSALVYADYRTFSF